jgi:hypothetical protein
MKLHLNKVLLTLSLVFALSLNASSQTVTWDSTYRPSKYKEIVAKWKTETPSKKDYIFLGNSITAGTDWVKLLNLPQAKNRGISGDITFGILDRLQDVIDGKPKKNIYTDRHK